MVSRDDSADIAWVPVVVADTLGSLTEGLDTRFKILVCCDVSADIAWAPVVVTDTLGSFYFLKVNVDMQE